MGKCKVCDKEAILIWIFFKDTENVYGEEDFCSEEHAKTKWVKA